MDEATISAVTATDDEKKSRNRSPNHPVLSLPDALAKAKELHDSYGKHQIPVAQAHKKWGYAEHGSVGNQCIAALKSYGLIDATGQGKSRKVQITEHADRIIRGAPDRAKLLALAAREPAIHSELLEEYKENGLPHDDILKNYLVWERERGTFNEDVVDDFIERFRQTLAFAGLAVGVKNGTGQPVDTPKNGNDPEASQTSVRVGSFVQWTSDGIDQFPSPLRVVGVSDDGDWAFVEGSPTGVPMIQLDVVEPDKDGAAIATLTPPANPFFKPPKVGSDPERAGVALERMTLDEGPVKIEWPAELSKASVEELEYWLTGLMNRAKRKAKIDEK